MEKIYKSGAIFLIVIAMCFFNPMVVGENYNIIELDTLKEYKMIERGIDVAPDFLVQSPENEEKSTIPEPTTPPEPKPIQKTTEERKRKLVVAAAYDQLGKPYVYAGQSPNVGFDCSGLAVYAYEQSYYGYLPHGATDLALGYGVSIPYDFSLMIPGDLIFFGYYSHVGIYVGNGLMIHASSTYGVVQLIALTNYPNYPTLIKRLYQ